MCICFRFVAAATAACNCCFCCCLVLNYTKHSQAETLISFRHLVDFICWSSKQRAKISIVIPPYWCAFNIFCLRRHCFQPQIDGHFTDIVDDDWRTDQLPHDPIWVPTEKLPDPEADNGDSHLTLFEQVRSSFVINSHLCIDPFRICHLHLQEQRWTDLALATLAPEFAITDQINISAS